MMALAPQFNKLEQIMSDTPPENQKKPEIAPELLNILVCPLTKAPLTYDKENNELISKSAKLAYPIHNGIPVMLPEEARDLTQDE